MNSQESQAIVNNPPFPKNYAAEFLHLEQGTGVYLEDAAGNRYLDFGSGISVNALGYGREDLAKIAADQMRKLIHVSNLYTTTPAVQLARTLISLGDFAAVHFGNSGSEANEAALKYARAYALRTRGEGHHRFLSFSNAFHGRTMGSLSVTPTDKYKAPFAPLVPGAETIPYNDAATLEKTLSPDYAAVIVEPVQGEGGLTVMDTGFAEALNRLCRRHDVLLIADEVQTGLGRCGDILGSHAVGLKPDIVSLSKPLAGGLPLSATLIPAKVNDLIHLGEHGTTFGGGPVTTAVAGKVVETILQESFLTEVRRKAEHLRRLLENLAQDTPQITGLRGTGMLQGIVLADRLEASAVIAEARNRGMLLLRSGTNVLRIAPPLIISEKELQEGVGIIRQSIQAVSEQGKP